MIEGGGPGTADGSVLSDSSLLEGVEQVRARMRARKEQIEALRQAQLMDQKEEELLVSLYDLRTGRGAANGELTQSRRRAKPHPVVEAVVSILEESGRPLHISELMVALRQRDVAIPGSGQQANVIAHITRDKRVVRPMRGMYALAAWPSDVAPAGRRRRQRVRSSTRTQTETNDRS
jgi:hypothetical protein